MTHHSRDSDLRIHFRLFADKALDGHQLCRVGGGAVPRTRADRELDGTHRSAVVAHNPLFMPGSARDYRIDAGETQRCLRAARGLVALDEAEYCHERVNRDDEPAFHVSPPFSSLAPVRSIVCQPDLPSVRTTDERIIRTAVCRCFVQLD